MLYVQYIWVPGYRLSDMVEVRAYDLWLKARGMTRHCDYYADHGTVAVAVWATDEEYADCVQWLSDHNMKWSLEP